MSDVFVHPSNTSPPLNLEGTDDIILSSKELQQIDNFIPQIDISSSKFVFNFANDIQDKISSSCSVLLSITKDIPTNPEEISKITADISTLTTETEVGFFEKRKIKVQYAAAVKEISALADVFTNQQLVLIGKARELKDLERDTAKYRRWLFMHITAGTKKLVSILNHDIPLLAKEAIDSGDILAIEQYRALQNAYTRFENRLKSLKNSMAVANLSLTQIRLTIKDFDNRISEISKIIKNTIPNWQNQIKISIGIGELTDAKKNQTALLHETTKKLSKKADDLKKENATNVDLYEANISLLNILKDFDETSRRNNSEIFLMQRELERLAKKN